MIHFFSFIKLVDRIQPGIIFILVLLSLQYLSVRKMSVFGPSKRKFIGKYSYYCSNVLGQGYSGTVCLGKNHDTGKLCALKIIEKSILKYQAHKSMILCEIQFLTLLKGSQNILTLYDVYNTKNNLYLVVQLCNTDLKEYITAKRMIPEEEAIEIMQKILQGYKSIWRGKIVHRDLKPSNILLQDEQIKIADFGFSMFQKDKKQFEQINVGSPYYMPLEVLAYNSYSYQSDIWALGVIFYEMLTGKIPWKARTQKQLYQQLKNLDIQKIIPSDISNLSKEFIRRTLEVDPLKRIKPEELTSFTFYDKNASSDDLLKASIRSQSCILLQQQLKKSKILHNGENQMQVPSFKSPQRKYSEQIDQKNSNQDDPDPQIMTMPLTQQQNTLDCERMKAQNFAEKMDEVDELPVSPRKKKAFIHRKTSLEAQCQIFQIDLIEKKYEKTGRFSSDNSLKTTPQRFQKIQANQESAKKYESKELKELTMKNKSPSTETSLKTKSQKQLAQKQLKNQEVMKNFSLKLRTQIHFCRYIFKLLMKMIEKFPNGTNLIRQQLKQQMAAFIFIKLKKIESCKISDDEIHKGWLETKEWQKIKSILKQYKTRYLMSLKDIKIPKEYDNEAFKKYLRKAILYLYKLAFQAYLAEQERQDRETKTKVKRSQSEKSTQMQEDESEIMKIKDEIVILDQLITLKQLHRLNERYGWDVFQTKSKIESIVQGQPLKYIQKKHILAISSKLQSLKIL